MKTRHMVGCMTGTSIDGLDAALVRIAGLGLGMRAAFVRGVSRPLGEVGTRLRRLADQEAMTAGEIAGLAREFSLMHAGVVGELLAGSGDGAKPDLIAVHGQTVFHAPPVSWQLFNPAPLVEALGAPVVFDLRAADLARGGQGAPITPLADWVFFRHPHEARGIVNLGGFCNATLLPAGNADDAAIVLPAIRGVDVCACNHLLDGLARKLLKQPFDEGGRAALAGTVDRDALDDLEGVIASQRRAGRSLGTGDELGEWVSRFRARVSANDLAATACEGLGQAIGRWLSEWPEHAPPRVGPPDRVLLAGGGVHNAALVKAVSDWTSAKVQRTDDHGLPAAYREAAAMAVLGAMSADGVAITLAGVTGVRGEAPVAGVWAGDAARAMFNRP